MKAKEDFRFINFDFSDVERRLFERMTGCAPIDSQRFIVPDMNVIDLVKEKDGVWRRNEDFEVVPVFTSGDRPRIEQSGVRVLGEWVDVDLANGDSLTFTSWFDSRTQEIGLGPASSVGRKGSDS